MLLASSVGLLFFDITNCPSSFARMGLLRTRCDRETLGTRLRTCLGISPFLLQESDKLPRKINCTVMAYSLSFQLFITLLELLHAG